MIGIFVAVEGVDGVGKTTFIEGLRKRVSEAIQAGTHPFERYQGVEVVSDFKDDFGQILRKAIMSPVPHPVVSDVAAILAARSHLVNGVIAPAIAQGKVVLCDRFTRSTMAYQVGLHGFNRDTLQSVMDAVGLWKRVPDLELFLDAEADVILSRKPEVDDRMEEASRNQLDRFCQIFRHARDTLPAYPSMVIDASLTAEGVLEKGWDELKRFVRFHQTAGLSFNVTDHRITREVRDAAEEISPAELLGIVSSQTSSSLS